MRLPTTARWRIYNTTGFGILILGWLLEVPWPLIIAGILLLSFTVLVREPTDAAVGHCSRFSKLRRPGQPALPGDDDYTKL